MTGDDITDYEFYEKIARILESDSDDGQAAKSHLAAGRPIYYCEDAYPNYMIRKWPDGRRELVTLTSRDEILVVVPLEDKDAPHT